MLGLVLFTSLRTLIATPMEVRSVTASRANRRRGPRHGDRVGSLIEWECNGADHLKDQSPGDGAQQAAESGADNAAPITKPDSECRPPHGADGGRDHDQWTRTPTIRSLVSGLKNWK